MYHPVLRTHPPPSCISRADTATRTGVSNADIAHLLELFSRWQLRVLMFAHTPGIPHLALSRSAERGVFERRQSVITVFTTPKDLDNSLFHHEAL
jgi:hypothetical protein